MWNQYQGCPGCADGMRCLVHSDCEEDSWCDATTQKCVSCRDNKMNSQTLKETCVDGGGDICERRCDDAEACLIDSDCSSNSCVGSVCVSCFNSVTDGTETCLNGGGDHCAKRCEINSGCEEHADCVTGYCNQTASPKICDRQPPSMHCNDNNKDADYAESDVDCGVGCDSLGKLCQAKNSTHNAQGSCRHLRPG